MGNANLLGPVALLAIIVFAIRFAAGAPRRTLLGVWIALAAYLFFRASSATAYVAAAGVAIVLVTVLLMRRAKRPGERTKYYIGYLVDRPRRRTRAVAAPRPDLHRARPQLRPHRPRDDLGGRARARRRAPARSAGASRRRGCRATPPSTAGSSTTA